MAKHFAKTNVARYLHQKRSRKAARRRHRQSIKWARASAKHNALFAHFGSRSKVLEMMADGKTSPLKKGHLRFAMPPAFSVIDNPEQTLKVLGELAANMHLQRLNGVFLDFDRLTQYDLGANGLLDVLVDELSTQERRTGRRIRWRGTYPADPALRRFVKAMGVIKRLKIEHEYPTKDEEDKLALFDIRSKHYIRALRPRVADKNSRITKDFADHINRCLGSVNRELKPAARGRLSDYVGEIIDNAEEHAEMLDWTIQGYLDTHLAVPMCEIVIFNFGRSIADTFQELPPDSYTYHQVQKYIELHEKKGLFQSGWRKEDLYTLIALQGNVSTKNFSSADTRGNGTVDLIQFFQRVHQECTTPEVKAQARMTLVSGSTYILFDGKYQMTENSKGNRVIAFNATNDLYQKPDPNYVRQLSGKGFPGTIISLKVPLSSGTTVEVGEAQ